MFGKINKKDAVIACFNFNFIGGSMGSVVGEKIARAIDYARKTNTPLIIISKSGGARMMEASFSLRYTFSYFSSTFILTQSSIKSSNLLEF